MMTRTGRRRFPILLAAIAALLALFGAPALPSTAALNPCRRHRQTRRVATRSHSPSPLPPATHPYSCIAGLKVACAFAACSES